MGIKQTETGGGLLVEMTNTLEAVRHLQTAKERYEDEETQRQEEERFLYKEDLFDWDEELAEDRFLFAIGGAKAFPRGELVGIKGHAKNGKSQLQYYLIASMLAGRDIGAIKPLESIGKILLFDTEQSKASLKKCISRSLRVAGIPNDRAHAILLPFYLRPRKVEHRRKVVETAIKEEKPDIVFIDGVRDLLEDFNDLGESNELVQWLLALIAEHGCTIVCVLHQNKSKEDANMRGHLGTELANKLADCFEVTKKDEAFHVKCTESRNLPCEDFAFRINEEGDFEAVETQQENDKAEGKLRQVFEEVFRKKPVMSYDELRNAIQRDENVTKRTAERRISTAREKSIVAVDENDNYTMATNIR